MQWNAVAYQFGCWSHNVLLLVNRLSEISWVGFECRLMDLPQYRTQIGAIRRERGRRLLRGSRSSREGQIRGESEQTREARRRDRMHAGIRKRQRDIEREALFFDISFWRAEEVVTPSYVLLDVSMCIATHNAKPLSPEELNIISIYALAGPLLAATVAHVNEQVKSHNL